MPAGELCSLALFFHLGHSGLQPQRIGLAVPCTPYFFSSLFSFVINARIDGFLRNLSSHTRFLNFFLIVSHQFFRVNIENVWRGAKHLRPAYQWTGTGTIRDGFSRTLCWGQKLPGSRRAGSNSSCSEVFERLPSWWEHSSAVIRPRCISTCWDGRFRANPSN